MKRRDENGGRMKKRKWGVSELREYIIKRKLKERGRKRKWAKKMRRRMRKWGYIRFVG